VVAGTAWLAAAFGSLGLHTTRWHSSKANTTAIATLATKARFACGAKQTVCQIEPKGREEPCN
jgi:hypothetical protein